ncbi:glycosyltransferase 87 family protein [Dactylosporangium sp. NBC_01737]|uniref:glycosyltransferase 87 family protein n=1 Tax=Dactylosporangium sp. NBC_01737 TaxID=2975959 RepID=UPI002E0DAA47|nr:glycosyltransferase 87 family protein [Dactylosporangium sp. NBC_01737]
MFERKVMAAWAAFGGIAAVSAALVLRRPDAQRLSDLHIYYGAAKFDGPLYDYVAENGGPFTYPPFAMVLFRPLSLLPEATLGLLWLAMTCAAVIAIARTVTRRATEAPGASAAVGRGLLVAGVATALLVSAPVQSNLRFGQVSIFIVLLALVDAGQVVPARYRGILVGVAAAIKLTPLLFVVYFLVARRYKDAARAGAAFAGCAAVAAVLMPGASVRYWGGTIFQTSRIGDLASLGNQSVHGMLLRVGLSPATLPVVWAVLIAAICGAALLRARHLHLHGEPVRAAVLVGCATVAASPVSWTHHQVWTVLAAMLLVAADGAWRRVAGWALLVVMTLSLGVVLRGVALYPGWQFLLENARSLGLVAVCVAGVGGAAAVRARTARFRATRRVAVAVAAGLAVLALTPLPAGADPTFKAYSADDLTNPRYFYFTGAPVAGQPVTFMIRREKTKVRVNGVVGAEVARLRYTSAPGGAARGIPLLEAEPGVRTFSFRSASLVHGRLEALDAAGQVTATFTNLA